MRLVDASDDRSIERYPRSEREIRIFYSVQIVIYVKMFHFNIGYDGDSGRECEERTVKFVRFRNDVISISKTRVRGETPCPPDARSG